ncbi:MAG: hypothetical protein KKD05_10485 [Candidatus Omnitrophica bacterium]|nr:hypothetical protein [Candidatus Omnitrophota bacterium]
MKNLRNSIKETQAIDIAIDTWDDVFSDFDPRSLSERTLSEDFMIELRQRSRETNEGDFIVTICAPETLRDKKTEQTVAKRLKRHFLHRSLLSRKVKARIRLRGIVFIICGICFLSFLTMAAYYKWFSDLMLNILGIVVMPLGWFGIWEGFSKIVDISPSYIQEEKFYTKLGMAQYRFKYLSPDKEKPKEIN